MMGRTLGVLHSMSILSFWALHIFFDLFNYFLRRFLERTYDQRQMVHPFVLRDKMRYFRVHVGLELCWAGKVCGRVRR